MQADNRIFDDFVKFVNGAAGTFAGMAREGQADARAKFKEWIGGQDFVRARAQFLRVFAWAASRQRTETGAPRLRVPPLRAYGDP